jgi:hypothetical protein
LSEVNRPLLKSAGSEPWISSINPSNPVNLKNVSETSWEFEHADPARRLVDKVRSQTGAVAFDLAVVLGSGWKDAVGLGETLGVFNYQDWSCFPGGQIEGHDGQLIAVRLCSWNVLFF